MKKIKKEDNFTLKMKELNKKLKEAKDLLSDGKEEKAKEIKFENKKPVNKNKKTKKVFKNKENEDKTYVIPLGGIEEIGKNCTAIQYKDEIIVVDAGLIFPEDEHLGIDLIIPSFEYLALNESKVKALLITHGHEDHIGSVPYFYQRLGSNIPMYGGKLTLALALSKFERTNVAKPKCVYINNRNVRKISKYFTVEFVSVTHSIPDCYAIRIQTPNATILHTGDFKIDFTPVAKEKFDFGRLAAIGEEGVDLMLSDSTNSQVPGFTPSESIVGKSIDEEVAKTKGRVIIASFASHVHRLQQIVYTAQRYGRKVAVDGRSMIKIFDICSNLGYLKLPKNIMISIQEAEKLPENKVMIICTGTQGEPLAVLSRIANGSHKSINLRSSDKIIISGSPIPGNEKAAYKNINQLLKNQCEVVYEKDDGIHVSGHGCQEEQKLMLNLIKPTFFMPVHGEYMMLRKHKETATQVGIKPENVIISENGSKIELSKDSCKIVSKVPSGAVYIYGDSVGNVREQILKERQSLADNGVLTLSIIQNAEGNFVGEPIIYTKGFLYKKDDSTSQISLNMRELIKNRLEKLQKNKEVDVEKIRSSLINGLSSFFGSNIGKVPTIIVTVLKV